MKRMPSDFYKELAALRSKFGETEYSRDDLLPGVMGLIAKHLRDDKELLREAANQILDNSEKSDDAAQGGFFPYDAHVALGEKKRIKRGAMNFEQHMRLKRVIDRNHAAQNDAWKSQNDWVSIGLDALDGRPKSTRRSEVLNQDGTKKGTKKAKTA